MRAKFSFCERTGTALAALLLALLLALSLRPSGARAEEYAALPVGAGLFGSGEKRNFDISMFPKWTGVLRRIEAERAHEDRIPGWRDTLAALRGRDRMTQLHAVNAFVNRVRYRNDDENYGVQDYWATPRELFARGGDCEDYAIAKYTMLRRLGWSERDLRLLVLQDEKQRILHAVLVAYVGGRAYVLDNQIKAVTEHRLIGHYRPIFSINRNAWWFHSRQAQPRYAAAPVERPAPAAATTGTIERNGRTLTVIYPAGYRAPVAAPPPARGLRAAPARPLAEKPLAAEPAYRPARNGRTSYAATAAESTAGLFASAAQ
jgi:predicted transglutaminase-like cysteine proteinase